MKEHARSHSQQEAYLGPRAQAFWPSPSLSYRTLAPLPTPLSPVCGWACTLSGGFGPPWPCSPLPPPQWISLLWSGHTDDTGCQPPAVSHASGEVPTSFSVSPICYSACGPEGRHKSQELQAQIQPEHSLLCDRTWVVSSPLCALVSSSADWRQDSSLRGRWGNVGESACGPGRWAWRWPRRGTARGMAPATGAASSVLPSNIWGHCSAVHMGPHWPCK